MSYVGNWKLGGSLLSIEQNSFNVQLYVVSCQIDLYGLLLKLSCMQLADQADVHPWRLQRSYM
jgi:hypothetical protein